MLTFLGGERLCMSHVQPHYSVVRSAPRYIILGNSIPNWFLKFANRYVNIIANFARIFASPIFAPFQYLLFEGQPQHIRSVFGGYVFVVVAPSNRPRRQSTVTTLGLHCHYHIEAQTLSV